MGSLDELYERIQSYVNIEDASKEAIESWIFHGDKSSKVISAGVDRSGTQRTILQPWDARQKKWEARKRREYVSHGDHHVCGDSDGYQFFFNSGISKATILVHSAWGWVTTNL